MGCSASSGVDRVREVDAEPPRFKFCLVGPPKSGKTSLARRFVNNSHPFEYVADRQVEFAVKVVGVEGVGMTTVELLTFPGKGDVDHSSSTVLAADGWMMVVNASTPFLGELLERTVEPLQAQLHSLDAEAVKRVGLPLMVVVTHMDVVDSHPELYVSVQESVLSWTDSIGGTAAFVSSRTNEGVLRAFRQLVIRAEAYRKCVKELRG